MQASLYIAELMAGRLCRLTATIYIQCVVIHPNLAKLLRCRILIARGEVKGRHSATLWHPEEENKTLQRPPVLIARGEVEGEPPIKACRSCQR